MLLRLRAAAKGRAAAAAFWSTRGAFNVLLAKRAGVRVNIGIDTQQQQ
jgi:hypothetical protein